VQPHSSLSNATENTVQSSDWVTTVVKLLRIEEKRREDSFQ
jgi:hypothetical protein